MKNKLANLGFEVAGLGLPLEHQAAQRNVDDGKVEAVAAEAASAQP